MSTWYRQGTISVTNGNATVTGIGTAWGAANTHPGDVLLAPDGKLYEILSIDSVTQLTIKPTFSNQTGYQGTTDTSGNAKYAIAPLVGSTTTADLAQRISAILTAWQDRQDELSDWQGGTVTGGDGNGYYPLTDSLGAVTHVMCPAKITALVGDINNELIAAQGYATSAQSSATSAQTYASQAGTSATSAGNSASAASTSATNAANSASSASTSASTATTKASEASSSASSAAASASAANTSATNAASSAASAAASASIVADGDKGDVVVSGGGGTWTLVPITPAKLSTGAPSWDTSGNATVAGNLNLTGTGKRITGDFSNATIANRTMFQTSTSGGNTSLGLLPHPLNPTPITTFEACLSSDPANSNVMQAQVTQTDVRFHSGARGSASPLPMTFYIGSVQRLNLATDGTFTSVSGAMGYGTGAGGTVTQATSKSTAVTLNKPCGQITMNNAALAAGATVWFNVITSIFGINDMAVVNTINGNYSVRTANNASGYFSIGVKNETAGSLSDAVVINFAIIKGANS